MMRRSTMQLGGYPYASSVHEAATALIRAGTETYAFGDLDDAQIYFDASHALLMGGSSSCGSSGDDDGIPSSPSAASAEADNSNRIIELAKQKLERLRGSKSPRHGTTIRTTSSIDGRFAPSWNCPTRNNDPYSEPFSKKARRTFLHELTTTPGTSAGNKFTAPSGPPTPHHQQKLLIRPDLYEAGECDVGPRLLNTPICPTSELLYVGSTGPTAIAAFLEAVIRFNMGLICHNTTTTSNKNSSSSSQPDRSTATIRLALAEQHYNAVSTHATLLLSDGALFGPFHAAVTEVVMRACNNLGVLYYPTDDRLAERAFAMAMRFAKQLSIIDPHLYNLEYATILSNWCRIQYLRGQQQYQSRHYCQQLSPLSSSNTILLHHAREVLRLRRTCLPLEHVDVAAAIWNVGAILYYHSSDMSNATFHLMQYLGIASGRSLDSDNNLVELDAVPALALLLMIQNKDRAEHDPLAQELVAGLSNLTNKRCAEGRCSAEVASILNYIGTILFHQQEYHHALVFFLEELRLEDQKQDGQQFDESTSPMSASSLSTTGSPSVISVTCNNVGRIMQELGRYKEAVLFYERSLKEWYGDHRNGGESIIRKNDLASQIQYSKEKIEAASESNKNAVINLYSTVWYNLGLISDKVGSFDDAMYAFEMALALRQLLVGQHHADVACLLYNIGVLQMEKNRLDEASRSLVQALRIRSSCDAGQLSDEHLIRTLQKLASLLRKDELHLEKAIDMYHEITVIHKSSENGDNNDALLLEAGQAWHAIAEIHQARNALADAVAAADRSIDCLRKVYHHISTNHDPDIQMVIRISAVSSTTAFTSLLLVAEQLIGCLLLQSSLYHELTEPILACRYVAEAVEVTQQMAVAVNDHNNYNVAGAGVASLTAITELTTLLSQCQCAAVA